MNANAALFAMATERVAACVLGADGYLGQFIALDLAHSGAFDVVHACGRSGDEAIDVDAPSTLRRTSACDFASIASCENIVRELFDYGATPRVVVNCAAMSAPGACERNPEAAKLANAPRFLWNAVKAEALTRSVQVPMWIQLSTDHVYDGRSPLSDESTKTAPVNAYGASKVFCEDALVQDLGDRAVVLRSSIITGPKPPLKDVRRTLFLDFVASSFKKDEQTSFYEDEFRSPVCVHDICHIVRSLATRAGPSPTLRVYNMGGPDRVSRVDMANGVAEYLASGDAELESVYKSKIARASCTEARALRGVDAPPDISMDSSALIRDICRDWSPRSFSDQIVAAFE